MSNEEIVLQIQNGINVTENMQILFSNNIALIRRFIKPYSYYESMEDLEQESYFGLIEAVKNYDESKGAKFITYAKFWIVQAVHRYVRCNTAAVRISSELQGQINRYNKYIDKYIQEHGEKPTLGQICDSLGLTEEQIERIKTYSFTVTSLDAEKQYSEEGESSRLLDSLADTNTDIEGEVVDCEYNKQMRKDVRYAVDTFLDGREKTVIEETFFNGKSLKVAGKSIGVTGERTRVIQAAALRRLRIRGRKVLLQYAELDASMYRGSGANFKQYNSSIVEHIAITRQELQREYEERLREAVAVPRRLK